MTVPWAVHQPKLLALPVLLLPFLSAFAAGDAPSAAAHARGYSSAWSSAQGQPALSAFATWADQYSNSTNAAVRAQAVSEGVYLAKARRVAFAELIKSDPEKALSVTVPADVRQRLPANIAAEMETRVSGIGDLTVEALLQAKGGIGVEPVRRFVTVDGVKYRASVYGRRAAQASKQGIPLHGVVLDGVIALHESSLREVESGETLAANRKLLTARNFGQRASAATVAEVGGKLYRFASSEAEREAEKQLEAAEAGLQPLPTRSAADILSDPGPAGGGGSGGPPPPGPSSPWTTGLKNVIVIRVDFSDLPGDPSEAFGNTVYTAPYCQNLADTQISPYYLKSSYGLTSLSNTVTTQLYRMPQTANFYATDPAGNGQLHTDAEAAAAANYNVSSYDRIIVLFSWLGSIPGSFITYGGLANLVGKNVWVNGEFDFRVVSHELGHTYGLYHAGLWQVSDGNPISAGGTTIEYGDDFDTMGANFANDQNTDFSPYYKNILGWVTDAQVQTAATDGTYRVYASDWANFAFAPTNQILAIKYVKDAQRTYWIGIRRNFTSNASMQNGAYIQWGLSSAGAGGGGGFLSQLLDMNTPGTAPGGNVNSDYDAALNINQPFNDTAVNFLVTPLVNGGTTPDYYMDIQIGNGGGLGLSLLTNSIIGGNGNGFIDPNECNDMLIYLINRAVVPITGVSGKLSSSTPGVIITQPSSGYPDFPAGATNANLTPFKISTSPNFICGSPIDFSFFVKSDQETRVFNFRLNTGAPGLPVRFDNNVPVAIPDGNPNGISSTVTVSNITSAVSKVTVSLHATHQYDGDVVFQLISPDGITNNLSVNHGSFGQNYGSSCSPDSVRTTFDDDTNTFIGAASAPFIGTFKPDSPLSIYIGKTGTNVNGVWQLHAVDTLAFYSGTLDCWSLNITPAVCSDGGGPCPGVDLSIGITDVPDPVFVTSNLFYTITVTNRGPNLARGVGVSLPLPPSFVFVSGSSPQGSVVFSGGTVSASLGTLDINAVATVSVNVIPTTNGLFSATATVSSIDTEVDPSNNSATASTFVSPNTADLAVGLLDAPDPVLVGGTLTYTVSVTNNGPSTAHNVTVTNILPNTTTVLGASSSQSNFTFAGNIVIWSLNNNLSAGGFATANIQVRPNAEGTIIATSTAGAQQPDPRQANNTAIASTTVGPSADVGIGILQFPNPVIVGSNLTYVVSITNFGPSTATGVTLNQTLPPSVTLLSSNTTQGTITASAGSVVGDLGSLASGAKATVTLLVATTTNTTLITTATVSANQADSNPANNSATATATVTNRILIIAPDGAKLTFESFCPANGTIEPGETVTNLFFLRNAGNVVNTNLVATLLPGGGVTAPSGPRSYGVLAPSGFSVGQPFSFTATGTNGGTVTTTFSLKDGPNILSNVSFTFSLPQVASFSNTNVIAIPDSGLADPYPSTITVSGISGLVGKVTATLSDFTHSYPHDVSALLVGPGGAKTILMSHVADQSSVSHATLTFVNDCVAPVLPDVGTIGSGSWQPSAYPPAVADSPFDGTTYANMSIYSGVDPSLINGTWSLYVLDDNAGDSGGISNGWSLAITTISPVSQLPDLGMTVSAVPGPLHAGDPLLYSFTVTNAGPGSASGVGFTNVLPASLSLVSVVSSQGSFTTNGGVIIANLGSIGVGASAAISILTQPNAAGLITNTGSVFGRETDPHPANNTASAVTSVVLPVADVGISLTASTNSTIVGTSLAYTVTVTNRGPENAVNIVVTDSLPKGLGSGSIGLSSVYWTNQAGLITCNLGTLPPATATSFTITATATNAGLITNIVTVATASSTDTNSANNAASAVVSAVAVSPGIIAAGATLNSENLNQNGAIDPGETVSVSLALANIGTQDTVNLRGTLLSTGGVTSPSAAQNYGVLVQNGPSVSKSFSFTASSSPSGGAVVATLQLTDLRSPNLDLGTVSFTFNLAATNVFANTNAITIPDHGPGNPYPSIINISGLPGIVTKVTATISNLNHSFARDVNILLVNPAGGSVKLMSHTSGAHAVTNAILTFDDSAAQLLPGTGQITNGTYKPSTYLGSVIFNSPAPSGNYGTAMNALNSVSPNGQWSLYVLDDAAGDSGNIANGWSLKISTLSPLNPVSDRLSIARTAANQSLLTLSGLSGHGYQFQVSGNLSSWTPLLTGTTAPNGTLQFTLTNSVNPKYYRSLRLP